MPPSTARWPWLLNGVAACFAVVSACGAKEGAVLSALPVDDDAGLDATVDATDDGADGRRDGMAPPDGATPDGCSPPCSADLHKVLDCDGTVVRTCPSDTGCSPGNQCVPPCDSATANHTSIGCEYYAIDPDGASNVPDAPMPTQSVAGSCYAVFLANTWTAPVTVHVDYDGQTLDVSNSIYAAQRGGSTGPTYTAFAGGQIPANQVGILFLAQSAAGDGSKQEIFDPCPAGVTVAYTTTDPAIHGTGKGHAFHLTTSAPVVAFDIWPYGGGFKPGNIASATLLLPTGVWNTNYVAVTGYKPEAQSLNAVISSTNINAVFDSNVTFVASQDHTTITINPVVDIVGGTGVAKAPKGAPAAYVLDRGESIQFEQGTDLSGSAVLADKPIGAWGGHWAMQIPLGTLAGDSAHQQIPPVAALGSEYVAVRYRSRTATEESVPWRIVGAVDGTTLTYEPRAPSGAPTTLGRGQVVELDSAEPFVIKSQGSSHPFYFAAHMTDAGLAGGMGDPETVNVVPPAQFMGHYVFFTDPTYKETNLVVVRPKGGPQVSLDCSGALTGWQAVGARYEYARVDVQTGGAKVGSCDNGVHEMTSTGPFGLTVWGFDVGVSYAYPAGAALRPINGVVVSPQLR